MDKNKKVENSNNPVSSPSGHSSPKSKMKISEFIENDYMKATDFINSLFHEFLLKKSFTNTMEVFQEEINYQIKNNLLYSHKNGNEAVENGLIQYFNLGKKYEFFKIWNKIIPMQLRTNDGQVQKVEFYLHMYFALYPSLPIKIENKVKETTSEISSRMNEFKTYIDTREMELSKTTEFLAFYALPFVKNPKDHPSYKHIFKAEWVKELKDNVHTILTKHVSNRNYPLIYELYTLYQNSSDKKSSTGPLQNNQGNQIHNHNMTNEDYNKYEKVQEDYMRLKRKEENFKITMIECQKKWTNFALEILNVSFELINNINKIKSGNEIPFDYIETLNHKLSKYDVFLKKNAEELDKNNISIHSNKDAHNSSQRVERNEKVNKEDLIQKQNFINNQLKLQSKANIDIEQFNSSVVDTKAIKVSLKQWVNSLSGQTNIAPNPTDRINYILRELYYRISRKRNKSFTIYSILYYDLLEINMSSSNSILTSLLNHNDTSLRLLRLLNALTNENLGRSYLLKRNNLIEQVVNLMIGQNSDTDIRQNCLGIIQKFTLRSDPQKKLIELDVIRWIVAVLIKESDNITEYTLEYGLALLMNLSLRSSGRDKCELVSKQLMKILIAHINNESIQVRTCINGTLYSLLKRNKLKVEAKAFGLEKVLKIQLENPNEQMKKQIQYIINEIDNDTIDDDQEVDEEDFEDEGYADEEEENLDEEYVEEDSINEDLLEEHYAEMSKYIIIDEIAIKKEIDIINSYAQMTHNQPNRSSVDNNTTNLTNRDGMGMDGPPLRRPTTPMTNLNSTSNSQLMGDRKSFIRSRVMKTPPRQPNVYVPNPNNQINSNMQPSQQNKKAVGEIDVMTTAKAFESKSKLPRTPPKK